MSAMVADSMALAPPETPKTTDWTKPAAMAIPKLVLTSALCGVPAIAVMLMAGPGTAALFVRLKTAGVATPDTVAVTV